MEAGYHLTGVDGCPLLFVFLVSTRTLENRKSPAVSLGSSRMRYFYFLPAPSPHKPTAPRRDGALEAERGRAGRRLHPAVMQRAGPARRRVLEQRQSRAAGGDAGAAAAAEDWS